MASTVSFLYIFNIRQNSRIYWLHSPLGINLTAFVSIPICLTPLTSCILPFHSPLLDYYQPVSLCILLLNTCKTLTIFLGNITYYIQNPFLSFSSQGRGAVCRWLHTLPSLCFWKQLVFAALLNLVWLSTAAGLFSVLRCKISKTTVCAHAYAQSATILLAKCYKCERNIKKAAEFLSSLLLGADLHLDTYF